MAWADMRERMDRSVLAHLNDGCATYTPRLGGAVVRGVPVIVEHNLMRSGPEGVFRSESTGIAFRKTCLAQVERGGVFEWCGRRFTVEDQISDDGHWITAACMEQK